MTDHEPVSAETMLNGSVSHPPGTTGDIAEEYDLLPKLIPHFDRHLIYPLLEFVSGQESKDYLDTTRSKYELLKPTNMTDYVANLWKEINDSDDVPEEFVKKREEVLQRLQLFTEETGQIMDLLNDESVVSNLRSDKVANLKFLETSHGVTVEMVDMLYDYGRFQYSCGNYGDAAHLLDQFRILSTDNDKATSATWGKLAADILTTNWEVVMEEVNKVKESIDTKLFSNPLAQLQHRTWLIHWALFPFFNYEPARETICDLFFTPAFINTIQTNCPWILRYLAAAVITNRNRTRNTGQYQKQLKDLVRIVRQENYEYNDPVTDFVKALYIDFDFEEAQKKLVEAEEVLKGDFFLVAAADSFVEAARHLISESYCKIHQRIDIKDLSARLGLNQDEGEKWIVNLIRDTRVDAKIDYKDGTVVMNHPPQSVYQQVIERTKGISFRTALLSQAVAN
ncbi:eukaryotic translation initiation factor 3 subunit E [Xylographa trunciseda]|nr:eukaryotic translation initiation factor 3 subunit E [Xylographa trunciseda]